VGFSTDAVHAGQEPDPATGAVSVPIYQTSTYAMEELGRDKGFNYARSINPTRLALEKNLTVLEGGLAGHAFSSGMAAITTVMMLLEAGDHVICSENTYGGTYRLFTHIIKRFGLKFSFVDTSRLEAVEAALTPETRMIFVETPTNPMMGLTDLAGVASLAGPWTRRGDGLRQHLHVTLPPAAPGPRDRHRGPFHHQVPQRPLGLGGRCGDHQPARACRAWTLSWSSAA